MNLFWQFTILNCLNVIIQTIKSLVTIKCGKFSAALVNAVAFGFYQIILVYAVCDLELWQKVVVVGLCNLIGVFIVKLIEEKSRKDKLWKVEATIPKDAENRWTNAVDDIRMSNIPMNYLDINKYIVINCFCSTQKQSATLKKLLDFYDAKYFVTESKTL